MKRKERDKERKKQEMRKGMYRKGRGRKGRGKLEIRSVERGICPIVTLYSLLHIRGEGRCKHGAIIFHGGRVVVNFVPKFVAMATGVGRQKI